MAADIGTYALDAFEEDAVQDLLDKNDWMLDKSFRLLTKRQEVTECIDLLIEKGRCAFDLETNGLNTRVELRNVPTAKIVGVCLAHNSSEGIYIPVGHDDTEYNLPHDFMVRELKRLVMNCVCIYHNFKFDGAILKNLGIFNPDETMYEDTLIMAAIEDASRKELNLKVLSAEILKRPMIEIDGLGITGNTKKVVAFNMVHPRKAVFYGGSDAMNTFGLYEALTEKLNTQDPTKKAGPWAIYNVEKRCLFVTMEMENNLIRIDIPYLKEIQKTMNDKCTDLLNGIFDLVGRKFDINSNKQLGTLLFDELKIPYPSKERTASGQYQVTEEILDAIESDLPVAKMILSFRGLQKLVGTYVTNLIINTDENSEAKFQMNQNRADTGRYTASGGKGLYVDGCSGVNCQNIPTYDKKDPDSIDIRKALRARPGKKIVTIDYSGEELRIGTNLSREPNWLNEFIHGTGDLHTITAKAIFQQDTVDKVQRGTAKTLNFLTLYGGGAGGFSAVAKIPYETAKIMQFNFFKENKVLKSWITEEAKRSRKRGYSKTALGRRRPLGEFYTSPDKGVQAKGDRCAVNSCIQGCLQPDERILTSIGYIPIKELYDMSPDQVQNLKVWTGTTWETFHVLNRGKAQFASISLSNGMKLMCDTRHEVLVVSKGGYIFKHYEDLKDTDQICVSMPAAKEFGAYPKNFKYKPIVHNSREIIIDTPAKWDFIAYLIGCLTGDGTLRIESRQSATLSFGKSKVDKLLPYIKENLQSIGLDIAGIRESKTSIGESYQIDINSKGFVDLLSSMGLEKKVAREKRVPEFIFRAPLNMRKEFIKGYWDTDGCKDTANNYGFHTPNLELLRDMQKVGWTLGLSSTILFCGAGTYKFLWEDINHFRTVFNVQGKVARKHTSSNMTLPDFLREEVYNSLIKKRSSFELKDVALLSKIKCGKRIGLPTVYLMLTKYSCELPTMYYHYSFKSKEADGNTEDTFTLSVHSELHRFDSSCIISKNTGADVIKIALYRVWKWIHSDPEREQHIKILLPIHDEIVYEITETKMEYYIPELCRIMKLDDITTKLGWEVKFDVDAEYGDTLSVTHDFKDYYENGEFERIQKLRQIEEGDSSDASDLYKPEVKEEAAPAAPVKKETVEEKAPDAKVEVGSVQKDPVKELDLSVTIRDEFRDGKAVSIDGGKLGSGLREEEVLDNSAVNNPLLKNRVDARGYFNYTLKSDTDEMASLKVGTILKMLIIYDEKVFLGPSCRIKLLDKSGEVLFKSRKKFNIDAFVALCLWSDL